MNLAPQLQHTINEPSILQLQISKIYKRHSKNNNNLLQKTIDPVQTSLFVHNFTQLPLLPIKTTTQHKQSSSLHIQRHSQRQNKKTHRFHTLDNQCSQRFKSEMKDRKDYSKQKEIQEKQQYKKQFVQVDMLKLKTIFAKNNSKTSQDTQFNAGQRQIAAKDFVKIPSQANIADFIKNYKPSNQLVNVDRMVKSQFFSVVYKQNESLYFGDVRFGQLDGQGILITVNYVFEGFWRDSSKIQGIEKTSKGYFKGRFDGNERSKVGQFFWNNGQYYSGEWLKNKKHGNGVWKSKNGDIYMGSWKKGAVQGFGVHLNKYGQKYQGFFHNFLKHGKGTELFPNGDYFQGEFIQGKPHGSGMYKWRNGTIYQGQFKQGYRSGKGTITKLNLQYQGLFLKEKAHGQGKLFINDEQTFIGRFRGGKKQGKGLHKQSHKIQLGYWHDNKFIWSGKKGQ